jgi:outer membrane protein insertion porin family
MGGLRTLTVGAAAQTGIFPLESAARREYRLGISLFEPYVGDRRLSLGYGPFGEYRDDLRDRSWRGGVQGSLVFATGPLRSIALGYSISHRRILEFGFGNVDPAAYLPILGLAQPDSVGLPPDRFDRNVLTLSGTWGRLDRFANPRKGYVIRPRFEVTTPLLNSNEYALFEIGSTFFLPVRRSAGAAIRLGAGRIVPFGSSVRGDVSPFVALLRLRDVTFTAGGSRDVRGWGSDLIGPKLPKVQPVIRDTTTTFVVDQYAPVGGLARVVASAQINIPLPLLDNKLQTFFFVDGARIWTPDDRFRVAGGDLVQDRFFVGTGGGFGYETLVGAITVALGYKVNPSALDVRDPQAVMNALAAGRPIAGVPTEALRRWQLHFSIGATF